MEIFHADAVSAHSNSGGFLRNMQFFPFFFAFDASVFVGIAKMYTKVGSSWVGGWLSGIFMSKLFWEERVKGIFPAFCLFRN
jgi:hypothetical protein